MVLKKGFTFVELLVVMAVIALLITVLLPSLAKAKLQAGIVVVNADLRQIGLALELYYFDNREYPPTRQDCNNGDLHDHLYQLPKQLSESEYLPAAGKYDAVATIMEDRFNRGHTYKYRSVGESIVDRDIISKWIPAKLWVPDGFPVSCNELRAADGQWYSKPGECPVSWVVFSLGPQFDEQWLKDTAENRYPIPQETWYNPSQKKGFLVRLHAKNGNEYGSFEGTK